VPNRVEVCVCVCTYRRPAALDRLLTRLGEVATAAGDDVRLAAVVVDDDPDLSARATVEGRADDLPGGVSYVTSGAGNIATARNLALTNGCERGRWLALTDDDCEPDVAWVRELVAVQARTGADCVTGACVDVPPPGAPHWLVDEPFLDALGQGEDGGRVTIGPLKNTLLSAEAVEAHGLRFDEAYGHAGGEDVMFFRSIERAGLDHRHAAHAIVREQVPPERTTLRYQLGRRFWYGNTEAVTSVASGRAGRAHMAGAGAKMAALGLARPLTRLARGRRPQVRYATSELLRGIGRVLGAAGLRVRHR
jgi:succinoglycan biosynthesis protein ExoM